MSTINTNGINVNYPVPGQNNSSQGFRDNFTSIKTNLDTAANEISDLQNKVVLKQALANTVVNNDMANTLISNASILGFRSTTKNLGNDLSGPVVIDLSLGDVQYGTVAANSNISIQFGNWGPTGTQSNVQLILKFNDSNSYVSFPSQLTQANNYGVTLLENYANVGGTSVISAPYQVNQIEYRFSTLDCGGNVFVEPTNRPQKATQFVNRTITTSNVNATGTITTSTSSATVTGVGTLFSTQLAEGLVLLNTSNVYIGTIASISSNTSLTLTSNANVALSSLAFKYRSAGQPGDVTGTVCYDNSYMYVCTRDYEVSKGFAVWKRVQLTSF